MTAYYFFFDSARMLGLLLLCQGGVAGTRYSYLLDVSLLVNGTSVLLQTDAGFNVLSEVLDQANVDIGLHESLADLLQHIIDDLR